MKTKFLIALLLLLAIHKVYGQGKHAREGFTDYCVQTKSVTYSQIKNLYPYKETATIEYVSFISEDEIVFTIPKNGDKVDLTKLHERQKLNQEQTEALLDLLVNYSYDRKLKVIEIESHACYLPRNAIIFFNEKQEPIAYIEICFKCLGYKSEPKNVKMGEFCYEKYDLLKKLFQEAGVKYGVSTL